MPTRADMFPRVPFPQVLRRVPLSKVGGGGGGGGVIGELLLGVSFFLYIFESRFRSCPGSQFSVFLQENLPCPCIFIGKPQMSQYCILGNLHFLLFYHRTTSVFFIVLGKPFFSILVSMLCFNGLCFLSVFSRAFPTFDYENPLTARQTEGQNKERRTIELA